MLKNLFAYACVSVILKMQFKNVVVGKLQFVFCLIWPLVGFSKLAFCSLSRSFAYDSACLSCYKFTHPEVPLSFLTTEGIHI